MVSSAAGPLVVGGTSSVGTGARVFDRHAQRCESWTTTRIPQRQRPQPLPTGSPIQATVDPEAAPISLAPDPQMLSPLTAGVGPPPAEVVADAELMSTVNK